jgi:hypothetical protein
MDTPEFEKKKKENKKKQDELEERFAKLKGEQPVNSSTRVNESRDANWIMDQLDREEQLRRTNPEQAKLLDDQRMQERLRKAEQKRIAEAEEKRKLQEKKAEEKRKLEEKKAEEIKEQERRKAEAELAFKHRLLAEQLLQESKQREAEAKRRQDEAKRRQMEEQQRLMEEIDEIPLEISREGFIKRKQSREEARRKKMEDAFMEEMEAIETSYQPKEVGEEDFEDLPDISTYVKEGEELKKEQKLEDDLAARLRKLGGRRRGRTHKRRTHKRRRSTHARRKHSNRKTYKGRK